MTKFIKTSIILILLCSSALVSAQSMEVSINLQPGFSQETIDNPVYNSTTVPLSFAYRGGLEGTYFFNDTWGARLGMDFLTTRYHDVGVFPVFSETKEVLETTTQKFPISIYYLSVPVQGVYKIPLEHIGINVMAGFRYHSYLGSKDNAMYDAKKYPWYKTSYLSGNFGLEFYKSLTNNLLISVGITTDLAFTNFLEENDGVVQLNNKSRLWQIFVPVKLTYQFKK